MTPQIALDLSLDGITVLSRVPSGHADAGKWWHEGTVRLDSPDLQASLVRLRQKVERRCGEDFVSILILPDSQLLYTSFERDDRRPHDTIRSLLSGRTPYAVDDLTFDFVSRGERLLVAVVAHETLSEAETFAADHGFRPVAVVARPDRSIYPGIPSLGATKIALELTGGVPIELNLDAGFSIRPAPPLPEPEAAPGEEVAAPTRQADEEDTSSVVADEVATDLPPDAAPTDPLPEETVAGPNFSSRRRQSVAPDSSVERITRRRITPESVETPLLPSSSDPSEPNLPFMPAAERSITAKPPPRGRLTKLITETPSADRANPPVPPPEAGPDKPPLTARLPSPLAGASPASNANKDRHSKAKALSLPSLARRSTDDLPRGRIGAGLAVTLALLVGLMAVGLWSFIGPGRSASLAPLTSADRETTLPGEAELLRDPDFAIATRSSAALDDAAPSAALDEEAQAADGIEATEPDEASPDLAALLPVTTEDTNPTEAPSVENLVTPPLSLPGATPEELAEADEPPSVVDVEIPLEQFSARGTTDPSPEQPSAPTLQSEVGIGIAAVDPDLTRSPRPSLPSGSAPESGLPPVASPAPPDAAPVPPSPDVTIASEEAEAVEDVQPTLTLVAATAEGTTAPGGYQVFLGRPPLMPTLRPAAITQAPVDLSTEELEQRAALSRIRPVARPERAAATDAPESSPTESAFNAEELAVLSRTRPQQRPETAAAAEEARRLALTETSRAAAAAVETARLEAEETAAIEAARQAAAASLAVVAATQSAPAGPVSPLAVASAERPLARPRSIEREATRIVTRRREQASATPTASAPTPPRPAAQQTDRGQQQIRSARGDVARAATDRNVLRLNQINLIGIYGRPSERRALVRLSNGRYVKVEVGDRLDRGRVTAIGESELSYQRGSRNIVLRMPRA